MRSLKWMNDNAFVCWLPVSSPWKLEELLGSLSLPLNLKGNRSHPFHVPLSALRRAHPLKTTQLVEAFWRRRDRVPAASIRPGVPPPFWQKEQW
jgi:hypothetical protein